MTLQSTVNADIPFGVVGEIGLEGPLNAAPAILFAEGIVGRMFTYDANGLAVQGGAGALLGILANPKVYPNRNGDFAATLNVAAGVVGEFVQETPGIWLDLDAPAAIKVGMKVGYATATGILIAYDQSAAIPAGNIEIPGAVVVRYSSVPANNLALVALHGPWPLATAPL